MNEELPLQQVKSQSLGEEYYIINYYLLLYLFVYLCFILINLKLFIKIFESSTSQYFSIIYILLVFITILNWLSFFHFHVLLPFLFMEPCT